jgi:hypothetical protein
MPQYFPLPARTVTVEVPVGDNTVNVQADDTFDAVDTPAATLLVPDAVAAADALADATLVADDTTNVADTMGVAGTIAAGVTVAAADMPVGSVLVPEPVQARATLADATANVAESIRVTPRIASALADFGEVVKFSRDTGRGLLRLSSSTSGTGLHQVSQASPSSSVPTGPDGVDAKFRASDSAVNPNELAIVCGWRLSGMTGIRWAAVIGEPNDSYIFSTCYNESVLTAADATLYATLLPESSMAWNQNVTWTSVARLVANRGNITPTNEAADGRDVPAGNPVTGPQYAQRLVADPFDITAPTGRNLWTMFWQNEPLVVNANQLTVTNPISAWVEFSIL